MPSFAHSSSRRSACAAGRSRPVRPISPNAARPSRTGDAPRRRGDRERDREVGARLVDPHAAGHVDEDVGAPERQPACRPSTATIMASRFGSTPVPTRRGIARSVGETSACISSSSGRVPSSAQATAAPISPAVRAAEELRRVGHAEQPGAGHLEHAELVRRAEAVLVAAQDAVLAVAVALELEDAVDEVLEHARPGDRAVLRHMPDEDSRDAGSFATRISRAAASRTCATDPGPSRLAGVERLHRVDHADVGPLVLERRADDVEIGLGQNLDQSAPPSRVGAQLHLRGRLLAGDEQRPPRLRAIAPSAASSRVDFPTPGSPPTSTSEAGTSPPPSTRSSSETPVEILAGLLRRTSSRSTGFAAEGATTESEPCSSSTSVPKAPQPGHFPSQRPDVVPHSVQLN